jgi:hypothetical protein
MTHVLFVVQRNFEGFNGRVVEAQRLAPHLLADPRQRMRRKPTERSLSFGEECLFIDMIA